MRPFPWGLLSVLAVATALMLASRANAEVWETVSRDCGTSAGSPVYSLSEYSAAETSAAKALQSAKNAGNRAQSARIEAARAKIRDCKDKEEWKFVVLPLPDCFMLEENTKSLNSAIEKYRGGDVLIDADIKAAKKQLAKQGASCMKELTSKCIDPSDTQAVLKAIRNMQYAVASGGATLSTSTSGSDFGFWLIQKAPYLEHLTFCTETNFDCNGSKEFCQKRRDLIERYFLRYGFK